jgi:hypothetical protein
MPHKDISVIIDENEITAGQELHGKIILNYSSRYDSIVINSQILSSNDIFKIVSLNGKTVNHPYARLSLFRNDVGNTKLLYFSAVTDHVPTGSTADVKFRASIVQEHKEVASDIAFLKIRK